MRAPAWPLRLVATGVGIGSAIRIEQYAARRSLWLDEAMVGLNIVSRGYSGLTRPLQYNQASPVGWLWAERAACEALGVNEYALRLVPLVAGVASLALVAWLAWRLVGPWGAAAAAVLVALAPAAVRYSAEVKQYSTDMATALAIMVAATGLGGARRRHTRYATWALGGALAVWLSHPAVLVLTAESIVVGARALHRRAWRDLTWLCSATVLWSASFVAVYLVSLRNLGHNRFLAGYWAAGMAPQGAGVGSGLRWAGRVLLAAVADPAHWGPSVLGAAAVASGLGVLAIVLRRPFETALLVAPLVVAVAAAAVRAYPLQGRLALYLLPVGAIALGAVVQAGVGRAKPRVALGPLAGTLGLTLVIGVAVGPAWSVATVARTPPSIGEIRPVLQAVARQRRTGDAVWVHALSAPPARFYADITGVVPTTMLNDGLAGTACDGTPLTAGVARGRTWVVFAYRAAAAPADEQAAVTARLASLGHLLTVERAAHAAAYLFDFSRPADDPSGQASRRRSRLPCLAVAPIEAPPVSTLTTGPWHTGHTMAPPALPTTAASRRRR